jgi:tetratricopeptide (TPR) repeat protein
MPDDSLHATLARADLLTDTARHAEALEVVRPVLGSHPDDPRVHLMAAVCHLGLDGGGRAALAHAQEAARLEPASEHAYRIQALAYLELEQPREAAMVAERAVELEPRLWLAHYVLGHAALGDRYSTHVAERAAAEALRLAPHEPSVHLLVARTRLDHGARPTKEDRAVAERHVREALRLDPQSAEAVHQLARIQLKGSNPTKALSGFLGALRLDPQSRESTYGLSQAVIAWVWRAHLVLWAVCVFVVRPSAKNALTSGAEGSRTFSLSVSLLALGLCIWVLVRLVRASGGRFRAVVRATWRGDPLGAVWAALLAPVAVACVVASVLPPAPAQAIMAGAMIALIVGVLLSWLRFWPGRRS